jgi:site-specific recombinase XerD
MSGDNYYMQEFINYLREDERSHNTILLYVSSVRLFFAKYKELTNETVREYKIYMAENFKPKTVNCRLIAIKKYAECFSIPLKMPKGLKVHRQLSVENVITQNEFSILCNGLKEDNNKKGYWIVLFLAKTGARVGEFVRFKKKDLDTGYAEMFTKGKIRRIYIPMNLIEESKEYFLSVQGDLLFPNLYKNQMTPGGIAELLKMYSKKYGIRREAMHAHSFRHFFAKEFLRKGGDLTLLSDLLGHESIGTTAIYTRCSSEEMTKKLSMIMG